MKNLTPHPRAGRIWLPTVATILSLACLPVFSFAEAEAPSGSKPSSEKLSLAELYTQKGSDPSFESLLKKKAFRVGVNSTGGVKGSTIDVNNRVLDRVVGKAHPIPQDIKIHTVCNSVIPRKDYKKWTRWYQEDGNTQVFRMFDGEHNVRNSRPDAGRVESFSSLNWRRGAWHEWEGTYTIVKPHGCAIFQAKNSLNAWGVMINMDDHGNITLNHRRHQKDEVIAKEMTGKSFHLKVRDNGHDYEVYLNGKKVGDGHYARPKGSTSFRWGMYGKTFKHDALIFVTGARFK